MRVCILRNCLGFFVLRRRHKSASGTAWHTPRCRRASGSKLTSRKWKWQDRERDLELTMEGKFAAERFLSSVSPLWSQNSILENQESRELIVFPHDGKNKNLEVERVCAKVSEDHLLFKDCPGKPLRRRRETIPCHVRFLFDFNPDSDYPINCRAQL